MSVAKLPNRTARLLDAIATRRVVELSEEIGEALLSHETEGVALASSLGLDLASRTKARNSALQDAAAVLANGARSRWETAQRLEAAIGRFETRVWPRCRSCTAGLGPVDSALRIAFLTGRRIPKSAERLLEYVPEEIPAHRQ